MPSADTQFKPGHSGNPAGRPRPRYPLSQIREQFQKVWDEEEGESKLRELINAGPEGFTVFLKLMLKALPAVKAIEIDARVDHHLSVDVAMLSEIAEDMIRKMKAERLAEAKSLPTTITVTPTNGSNGRKNGSNGYGSNGHSPPAS